MRALLALLVYYAIEGQAAVAADVRKVKVGLIFSNTDTQQNGIHRQKIEQVFNLLPYYEL